MHVLSLPPAFVLSQNQTLKFYEFVPTYARFDEDTLFINAEAFSEVSQRSKERRNGVSQKRVRRSLVCKFLKGQAEARTWKEFAARLPPSTFLFLPIQLSKNR